MNIEVKEQLDSVHRAMVCYYGCDFMTEDRVAVNVGRRQVFVWVARRVMPGVKLVDIAEFMGKHHATVIYCLRKVGDLTDVYPRFVEELFTILNYVRSFLDDEGLGLLAQPGYEV